MYFGGSCIWPPDRKLWGVVEIFGLKTQENYLFCHSSRIGEQACGKKPKGLRDGCLIDQQWRKDWETSKEIDGMLSIAGDSVDGKCLKAG